VVVYCSDSLKHARSLKSKAVSIPGEV
jgi:hypothetical protein